jgi:hypothetical protein
MLLKNENLFILRKNELFWSSEIKIFSLQIAGKYLKQGRKYEELILQ